MEGEGNKGGRKEEEEEDKEEIRVAVSESAGDVTEVQKVMNLNKNR